MSQSDENLRFTSALSNFSIKDFWREHKFSYMMLLPAFIVVLFVVIYPFFYNFRLAFSNLNMYNMRQFIQSDQLSYIGIDNFIQIITESSFWIILLRTVAWTVINVVAHVGFGIFYAIILDRDLMFKSIYRTLLVIPWAIPQYIVVLIWKGMFNFRYGAVNLLLRKIGVPGVAWLSQASTGFSAALIVNIWLGIPFMMMIALGGLQSIDPNFYEAAEIDGASNWQQIKHITLPLLKPVMLPAVILGVVWTFNNLRVIYLLTQNTLTNKIDILVTHVYRSAFEFYRYGYAAAFSLIIFVILLVWAISFIDYINED
ncbi:MULTISPECIES: carbohydrate ABC transporter permease [Halanaerobium]|uniref:Arabinogalactan oligomer / maltooligosaccharide transport system permease protein n=1 Tax=Halanaerobium kushneri TaxID=56779 RepID=A0A1N6PDT2_9FIRM|nr:MULTISPECIES: sugar ABC transporter permease [Halanaerobium]RCW58749.1 arabinogalactan oligomer/maltooligosaccharide transport system permease protein [Halanaerobium sp. ST460_2HS_T2]SIQ02555.1 arabinogalactan oligomer / maltooligosaccharide transport system permease protein [Halanaerobium kushneri]